MTFSPLQCFTEGLVNIPGFLRPQWLSQHPYSLTSPENYGAALSGDCLGWMGLPMFKEYTMGGLTYSNSTKLTGIKGLQLTTLLTTPDELVRKWQWLRTMSKTAGYDDVVWGIVCQ